MISQIQSCIKYAQNLFQNMYSNLWEVPKVLYKLVKIKSFQNVTDYILILNIDNKRSHILCVTNTKTMLWSLSFMQINIFW